MKLDTKESIKNLKDKDAISVLLFAIYKCTKDPNYSTLSELIYSLDMEGIISLCTNFGGCTLKIPTLSDLKIFLDGLLVYRLMEDGYTFKSAFDTTGLPISKGKEVFEVYKTIKEILENYGSQENM